MKNLTTIILFAVFATTNAYSQELTAVNTPQTSNSETNAYNLSPEKVILQEKGFIVNGKKVGKWISKNPNGNTISIVSYDKDGNKDGVWESHDENGTLRTQSFYKNGERVGEWKMWNEKGELVSKKNYASPSFSIY